MVKAAAFTLLDLLLVMKLTDEKLTMIRAADCHGATGQSGASSTCHS